MNIWFSTLVSSSTDDSPRPKSKTKCLTFSGKLVYSGLPIDRSAPLEIMFRSFSREGRRGDFPLRRKCCRILTCSSAMKSLQAWLRVSTKLQPGRFLHQNSRHYC
uniref:Uncharacterized protein n=1 Tax=Cacopsylla melanoneura TaxID=428564 RepID=A0A8D9FIS9_9HEMI